MTRLRTVVVLVVLAALLGAVAVGRSAPGPRRATFSNLGEASMPFVPSGSFISSSWFCPGAPVRQSGTGASVTVANPTDERILARVTVLTNEPAAAPAVSSATIDARSVLRLDLGALQPRGTFLSSIVEIEGGGGIVEQQAEHQLGNPVAPCSNATSASWYFAEGFTSGTTVQRLVLTNPYPVAAVVDVVAAVADGVRSPPLLQGFSVPAHSVRLVDLGIPDQAVIAARVTTRVGRLVAARFQQFAGGAGRIGYTLGLGAPSLSSQQYFADGEVGANVVERYSVYNPTQQEVVVDAIFLGLAPAPAFANDHQVVVPPGRVVVVNTADVIGLPTGRHGALFTTEHDSIVVERSLTRPVGQSVVTSVVLGAPGAFASPRWSAAVSNVVPAEEALVVLNVDDVDTTVTVSYLGPGGMVPVPGLEAVALPAGGVIALPLTDPSAFGRSLLVESPQRLFVERSLPRSANLPGRTGSFALPG